MTTEQMNTSNELNNAKDIEVVDAQEVQPTEFINGRKVMPSDFWNYSYNPITGYLTTNRNSKEEQINIVEEE